MWICLNDAFLSIVDKDCKADELLVRARRPGDLDKTFPGCIVAETPDNDYAYRTVVKRSAISAMLSNKINNLHYDNFKSSVKDQLLKERYSKIWGIMHDLQLYIQRQIKLKKRW